MKSVRFKNRTWDIAADLRFPQDFDEAKKYPAIVCAHPISSCKEQTSGAVYGAGLAESGYLTLAFDASFTGESGGEPRYLEDPATKVEDIRCAVDYLVTLDYVDENRIGALGICGGGGYTVAATMTERRIKALGTVVAANYGRIMREGDLTPDAAIATLQAVAERRTAEARGAEPFITHHIPDSVAAREHAGLTGIDIVNAVEYYRTPRGQNPNSPNSLRFSGLAAGVGFDAFHLAEHLLTQPLQVIVGGIPGAFGSLRDGYDLFARARSVHKDLLVIEDANHYDLYDQHPYIDQALAKLAGFYNEHL